MNLLVSQHEHTMLSSESSPVTPQITPRASRQSVVHNSSNVQQHVTSMPALTQALTSEASALAESTSAMEIAMRLRLMQRIFRLIARVYGNVLVLTNACIIQPRWGCRNERLS
jgi:hypothetical protein